MKRLLALSLFLFSFAVFAADTVKEGFSTERLKALGEKLRAEQKAGKLPGGVLLVQRNGKLVHQEVFGVQDPKSGAPMKRDSIFRVYSMTKPMVSVAVMRLVEQGRWQLADPASRYIPELKDVKVGVEKKDGNGGTLELVPAARPILLHDLLRHTSGLTYGFFGAGMVKDLYRKAGTENWEQTNDELMKKLSQLPLAFQPGTTWDYSLSVDVLGTMLERLSGQGLEDYLRATLWKPLGMKDTGFWVPQAKQGRIAEAFDQDPDTKAAVSLIDIRQPPKWVSGGGGAVSTADDYLRFAQMLLNGGELGGQRILSKKTVEYMMSDHLGEPVRQASLARGANYLPGPGYGFGLGWAVRTSSGESPTPGSVGDINWGGLGGTYFWVDPKEKLAVVWMAQGPGQRGYFRQIIRSGVYGAMVN